MLAEAVLARAEDLKRTGLPYFQDIHSLQSKAGFVIPGKINQPLLCFSGVFGKDPGELELDKR